MRMLLIYILLIAFGCQQSTDNGQQTSSTVAEPVEATSDDVVPSTSSGTCTDTLNVSKVGVCDTSLLGDPVSLAKSQSIAEISCRDSAFLCDSASIFNFSASQIQYYEYQIHLADSLYKNYLPQYNFDEVKAAVEFFDSLRLTTDNRHRPRSLEMKKTHVRASLREIVSAPQQLSNSASQQLSNSVSCAKAHYYHAVGLTERDDIVGACEHYLRALEIMELELETENLKNSKSELETEKLKNSKSEKRQNNSQVFSFSDSQIQNNSQVFNFSDSQIQKDSQVFNFSDSQIQKDSQQLSNSSYEKIRFLALIYTRLGRLFLNENYCELAITKYRKALKYVEMIDEKPFKANVLKELGNSYQLANKPDSALYYYNESLKCNSSLPNKLDVEKSIAQILIDKGERDSAYMLLKNNLYKINNDNVKYSYHFIIGDLFYHAEEYDSALYYLEESLDNCIISKRIAYVTKLSAIYDSLGDYEKRSYYDNISSRLFKDNVNKEVGNKQLQVLYDNYKERKLERERSIAKVKTRKQIIAISLSAFVAVTSLLIFVRYKHKRHSDKLSKEINEKEKYIRDNEFRYSFIEGKIKRKNIELQKKEEEIRTYQQEIAELKSSVEERKYNYKEYCQSEICAKILNDINELSKSGKDTSELQALRHEDFVMLLQSANLYLGNFLNNISTKYPSLKKEDLYYLCLTIINLNDKQIAALFGVTYNAIRSRRKKICLLLDINIQENICKKTFIHGVNY